MTFGSIQGAKGNLSTPGKKSSASRAAAAMQLFLQLILKMR
jgi:hypothetical protein